MRITTHWICDHNMWWDTMPRCHAKMRKSFTLVKPTYFLPPSLHLTPFTPVTFSWNPQPPTIFDPYFPHCMLFFTPFWHPINWLVTLAWLTMPYCGRCRREKAEVPFRRTVRGSLLRTCQECLVSSFISYLAFKLHTTRYWLYFLTTQDKQRNPRRPRVAPVQPSLLQEQHTQGKFVPRIIRN